ncbi:hypothetical protein [Luteibacter jiangsuensis]
MRARLGWLAWLVLVAACIWLPWHALFEGSGPFVRQLSRSLAWKSIAECLLLLGAVYGSLRMRKGGWILAALCAEIYARRHGVDITLALLSLYLGGIHAVGRLAASWLAPAYNRTLDVYLRETLLGIVIWSAAIWSASLAGMGSLAALRILAFILLGGALVFAGIRWAPSMRMPHSRPTRGVAFLVATITMIVLMLSAKAASSVDSDALWYGLNADRLLFADGGLFHPGGLIAHVHFYPKLTEALQAPFLGLGSASLVTGLSLVCWLLLLATAREILRESRVGGLAAWFGALVACAVPAVAASAATPKGELLAAWLCLCGILALVRLSHRDGDARWLGAGLAALILAPLARLTVLPYAALIFLLLVVTACRERHRVSRWLAAPAFWAPVVVALSVAFLVCLRTFQQTGVALIAPDLLIHMQGLIGWHLHDDIGRYEPAFRTPFPDGLLDSLFGPAAYIHQALFWMGNGWLPMLFAAVVLRGWRWMRRPVTLSMLAVGVSMYGLMYAYRFGPDGADGNYFVVPIVLLHMVAWLGLLVDDARVTVSRACVAGVAAITAFCLFLVLTTANWFPGTGRLDTRFDRTPFGELRALAAARYRVSGLGPLAEALNAWPAKTRMLGDMPTLDGGYFPIRYESLGVIAWARPPLLADSAAIIGLLHDHRIELVALSHDPAAAFIDDRIRPVVQELVRRGEARKLNIGDAAADLWLLAPAPNGSHAAKMGGRTGR